MPKMNDNKAPWHVGELMTQLRGKCQVVGVSPKMRDGKQKTRDGVPQWSVSILFQPEGRRAQLVDATMTAQEMPNLVGKSNANGVALGAVLWRLNGLEGWAYSLDGRLSGQFK